MDNILSEDFLSSGNKVQFLDDLFKSSNDLYGANRKIKNSDFYDLADLAIQAKDWQALKEIADLNIQLFPNTETSYYSRAKYEEEYNQDLNKALEYYKKGYANLPKEVTNKNYWYKEIVRMEKLLSEK